MKTCFPFLFLLVSGTLVAQHFSDKTNTIIVNYKQPMVASPLPSIEWTTPRIETSFSEENSIVIDALVTTDLPLQKLTIELVQGGAERKKDVSIGANEFKKPINQKIILVDGTNVIRIVAENTKGGKVTSTRSVVMGKDALAEMDANRKDYALLFATDNYDNWGELSNPINDAHTIAKILEEKYGFIIEVVENPSLEDITAKLYDYNTKKFNTQDQLFVFFAGHGYFDDVLGQGYVVASNSLYNDKGKTTYLAHTILRDNLENIKCEHIFLTMDVCFGGTFDKKLAKETNRGPGSEMSESDKNYLINKISKRTRKVLTSGGKEYVPDGTPGMHSPFATQFIKALKEIGGSKGRILSLPLIHPYFLNLTTQPYFNGFGSDDPQSDFVFVAKQ
jgi:Caspase domain